jgi:hypothetical protein
VRTQAAAQRTPVAAKSASSSVARDWILRRASGDADAPESVFAISARIASTLADAEGLTGTPGTAVTLAAALARARSARLRSRRRGAGAASAARRGAPAARSGCARSAARAHSGGGGAARGAHSEARPLHSAMAGCSTVG